MIRRKSPTAIIEALVAVMISTIAILICWQVVARYVFRTGQFWAEEISILLMMWIGMLGAAVALRRREHISLALFVNRLPGPAQRVVKAMNSVVICWFAAFIALKGVELCAKTMDGRMSATNIPIGITYLVMPIAGGLMVIYSLLEVYNTVFGRGRWPS